MHRLLLIFFIVPLSGFAGAQSKEDDRELFDEGNFFFAREDYSEAAYYFKKLTGANPQNSHFNFKLGECYMNIPGSEKLAIPFFEKATKNIVEKNKYRDKALDESSAPLHAWFYLGNVYRIAGQLDDALKAYNTFIGSPFYYGNYNENVVENEIKSCERAKIIMDSPVDAVIEPLDTLVNTSASELYPVISGDGSTLVFLRKLKFYDAILSVNKQGNSWGNPVNLNPLVGSDGDFYPVSLSFDGTELFLVRTTGNKDLYVSHKKDNSWTKAEPLGKNINTTADETWACLSSDGKTLWFTSSRKGGQGGLDIYYSIRDSELKWGKARNAGKVINTPFDEESPCLCHNDQVLFFSSKGHYSMGGFDIFYTTRDGKVWKEPVNIGYPINNTSDNMGFITAPDCKTGYYSIIKPDGDSSSEDIFRVILKSNFPRP